ncbi:MAG: GNAT family N-acetyltransferase [Pseudomonadales bacterium]|nr:GNAT family N-acetyltransferase [Pseudomonadales bacterium]
MIYNDLNYPSNVYATLLAMTYGQVEYTGYGIGDIESVEEQDLAKAQKRLADRLAGKLPPPPAEVLEIGCGLGTLAVRLAQEGYQVTAVSDNPAELALARQLPTMGVRFENSPFERFAPTPAAFDVVLLHNSAHYINPLTLLKQAQRCLRPGGMLLLVDAFVSDSTLIEPCPLPRLSSFLHLASLLGFEVHEQEDESALVAACLQTLQVLLERNLDELGRNLAIDHHRLEALQQNLGKEAAFFNAGRYRLMLLSLQSARPGSDIAVTGNREFLDIHGFQPLAVATLFEESFSTPFNESLWLWKYGQGRGQAICIREHGEVVAHYGGASRQIRYFGQPHRAMQICDVMVKPEKRGFYSRKGLFYQVAASFLELNVGSASEHLLGFGFPNIKAMHVATRLGLYEKTDDFIELLIPAAQNVSAGLQTLPTTTGQYHAEQLQGDEAWLEDCLNALWQRMASDFAGAVLGVRDWSWVHYRYVGHPTHQYLLYAVSAAEVAAELAADQPASKGDAVCAIAIFRAHEQGWLMMDIICEQVLMQPALQACHQALQRDHQNLDGSLHCWVSSGHESLLQIPGFQRRSLNIEIPCNRQSAGPATAELLQAWWLTAGDMDFM